MVVDNASGATVRSDINNALSAIVTLNSGASAPSTTYADMLWVDTTNGLIKRRNSGNSGWLPAIARSSTMVQAKTTSYTAALSDFGTLLTCTNSFTLSLTAVATLGDGWWVAVRNDGTGTITIDPNSTEQIDGATTITLAPSESCVVYCNGSAFKTIGRSRISGALVQTVHTQIGTAMTGAGTIPQDTSIPQVSEGSEFLLGTIVPAGTGNLLYFDVNVMCSNNVSGASHETIALFQGTVANALAAVTQYSPAQNAILNIPLRHKMTAGTTGTLVFSVRAGANGAGTTTLNGFSGTAMFGGVAASSFTIREVVS
jgi:hypothetical protein